MTSLLQFSSLNASETPRTPVLEDDVAWPLPSSFDIWDECMEDYEDAQHCIAPIQRIKDLHVHESEFGGFHHQAELYYGGRNLCVTWIASQKTQVQIADLVEIQHSQEPFVDTEGWLEIDGLTKVSRANCINLFETILPAWNVDPLLQREAVDAWELMEEGHQQCFNAVYSDTVRFRTYVTAPCVREAVGSEQGNLRLRLEGTRLAISLAENTELANLSGNLFAVLMNDQAGATE